MLLLSVYNAILVHFGFYIIYTGMRKGYINRGSMVNLLFSFATMAGSPQQREPITVGP